MLRLTPGAWPLPLELMHEVIASLRTLGKRSVIALVGIAIGSSSVIAMINIGSNATQDAAKIFQDMGVDMMVARLHDKPRVTAVAPLTLDTVKLQQTMPNLLLVAPTLQRGGSVVFNGHSVAADLIGATPDLAGVMGLTLRAGRFLSEFDQSETHVVVGHSLAKTLETTGGALRVGDRLRIGDYLYTVIGVLRERPASMLIQIRANDSLFFPLQGMRRIDGSASIDSIMIRTAANQPMSEVARNLTGALKVLMPTSNVNVFVPQQLIDGVSRQHRTFSYLLAALGGISLVGGGGGVMNVMLMNVSERRREIGIRMALGARRRDIRNLFLLEAFTLSALGALGGGVLGITFAFIYARFSGWTFFLAPAALPLGIISTLGVGVFCGLYPAVLASRLQPVEALRDD
ncbi:ABC transporter permease [Pseudomonas sp. PB3P13]